jgi:hypothetical protein
MEGRRPSLPSWPSFRNRKTRKHMGTPEKANFDFRRYNSEESVLFAGHSSRSSYSSRSSSFSDKNSENNKNPKVNSALPLGKIFLYLLPFIIQSSDVAEEATDPEKDVVEEENSRKVTDLAEIAIEVTDEVCSNDVFHKQDVEVDFAEAARDKIIEKMIVYPVGNPKVEKEVIENLIKEKFEKIGVGVLRIETRRSIFGKYKCSIVETSPVNLNLICERRLGIPDFSIIAFDP